jgi:site-specific DNA recombinase
MWKSSAVKEDAVLYARVSTEEQANKAYNLSNQLEVCRTFAEQKGFPRDREFIDAGKSARSTDRPEFQRMLEYCRVNRQIGYVIVQDLSRFARNNEDQARTINELKAVGVILCSVREPNVDNTATGRLAANMLGSFNQYFSDALSEKMADRCRAAIRNGRWPWRAPLGYRNVKAAQGHPNIVLDEERAPLIRHAFELTATGHYKPVQVLAIVTQEGLRTRTGRILDAHTFANMLRNPVYMGITRSKKEPPHQGLHEPLVSAELFQTVQDVLAGRRRKYMPHRKINPAFPLKGIRCTICNAPLTGYNARGKMKQLYAYYECKNCGRIRVRAEKMEREFAHLLNKLQPRPEVLKHFPKVAARVWSQKQTEYEKSRRALTRQLEQFQALSDNLMEKWLQGRVTDAVHQRYGDEYAARIAALEADLRQLDDSEAGFDAFLRFSELALVDMPKIWELATPEEKVRVRNLLFGDSLMCSPENKLSNSTNPTLFSVLSEIGSTKIGDGAP